MRLTIVETKTDNQRLMFSRRFKSLCARFCIALFCMQAVAAAYACPAFLGEMTAMSAHQGQEAQAQPMAGHCEEHPAGTPADMNMCHQHYAGDQSVGGGTLAAATEAPALPIMIVAAVEPLSATGETVLPQLLQRITTLPLAIRFQVLRI
ncbi:MAG TPA: hypothetical protein VIQ62_07320 [Burkholderiales bacterium]